ncbi:protein starmaker-like [Bradysia coprophila]|uniref:protein starmaker-like n=1 Tax=Bradysia coprophila TaxID=38358 RepID=UPI00187DA4C5|nr:protein starmaker-like [Bradysia coprophila]
MGMDLNTAESKHDEAEVSERDNEVGYLRRADEKGADAYQHFESFHDKDGDAYGYEKHEAFGKSNKDESSNGEKDKDEGSHYNYVQELGDKAKYQKYQGHNDDPGKGTHSNYHYSYNSDDDDDEEKKPHYSSNYSEETKKDDSSDEDNDEGDDDNDSTDEEKTTNFSYKIVSDDYAEDDGHGDVNSKGSDNGKGYGFNFGHGDKNTDVDYSIKRSDYTAGDDSNDDDNEDESEDESSEDDSSEEEDDDNVIVKDKTINDDEGKGKNAKSYSTYTTYSSEEGDDEDGDDDKEEDNKKPVGNKKKPFQKHVIRYENTHPKPEDTKHSNKIVANDDTEESNEAHEDNNGHVNEDVELHQPVKPQPPREHRTQYVVQSVHPQPTPQVYIQPSKPTIIVQEHHAGYKVEESGGDKASDDSGKGHAGSVSTHLYEIYVTHDTGKSNGGGGGGGDDAKGSEDDGGDDGKGKSENLVIEKSQKLNDKADANDNGAYNVNINYGKKKGLKKNGKKGYRKRKGNLKKKKIVKPHKYEVEEYIDSEDETKQSSVSTKETSQPQHREAIVAGKGSSPQHHRDSDDYSNGQQFLYASEADSDAYYW